MKAVLTRFESYEALSGMNNKHAAYILAQCLFIDLSPEVSLIDIEELAKKGSNALEKGTV